MYKKLYGCLLAAALILLTAIPLPVTAQEGFVNVTGKVIDADGVAMIGVTVLVKNGNTGTVTDSQGNFVLKVPSASTLTFTSLGYAGQEVMASPVMNVTLQPSLQALEEIVVVGYGTQRRKDLTGGVAVVGQKELGMVSSSNLMDRLVGQVAGLSITTTNAAPGSNQALLIRGQNSLSAKNDPLIILDGIPYAGSLADLDPNIIDNLTVLKDASSVAIYGSRGSNGVILIQTKKGMKGKAHVTYKGQFGLSQPMQMIEVMGPNEFVRLKVDIARLKSGYSGVQLDPSVGEALNASEKINYNQGITHNWQDYIFREVFTMDHQVNIMGGGEKSTYMAAVSHLNNDGVVYNSNMARTNVYMDITQYLNKWLTVGATTQFIHKETGGVTPNIEHAIKQSPYGIYKDELGDYYEEPMDYSNLPNPMRDVNAEQKNTTRNVIANGFLEIKFPIDGLSFKSLLGYNYRNNFTGTYYGRNTSTGRKVNGRASISQSNYTDYTWENIIRYDMTYKKHRLDLTGLFSVMEESTVSSSQSGENFVNDDSSFYRLSGAEDNVAVSSSLSEIQRLAYMFRANYVFDNKYLITLTGRADGASVFGKNNKFGFFPSAAIAWHIGEEGFVKDNVTWIDMLKLRLSYGANGNEAINPYRTLDRLYSTNGVKYLFGDGAQAVNVAYLAGDGIGNPSLKWETTYTANLGLDFAFFGSRLNGTLNLYVSNTFDLLMTRTVPIMNGYNKIWDNIGQTRNKGIELTLNTQNIRTRDFQWATDFTFFLNRDKIVDLRGDKVDDITNNWFIGKPLSIYYDYYMTGIWQEGDVFYYIDEVGSEKEVQPNAAPGSAKLKDVDGNGYIDTNDKMIIGNRRPSFTMSMGNRINYKNFYFSFLLNGVFGKWVEDNVANIGTWTFSVGNYIQGANYWTPENPDADIVSPAYSAFEGHNYYKKQNYIQIKNITMGYKVDQKFAGKLGMSAIDINVGVNNVHAFSNMRQILNYDNGWFASYPTARSYMLGLTLTF